MTQDEHLVSLARTGDKKAAESLFRRYQDGVYGYLMRLTRNRELAADAAQETFIRGFKGLRKYTEKQKFKSWLFTIAHNEGVRVMTKQGRLPQSGGGEAMEEAMIDKAPQPGEALEQSRLAGSILQAMDTLPAEQRTVVYLRIREEMPFKEIAEITGSSLNTTLGRMHNARKKLRAYLDKEAL